MLYFLLFVAGLAIGFIYATRRHFNSLTPAYRLEEQHGPLQVRRYAKMAVAEVRVSGGTSLALRSGTFQLDKYFRDEQIARFALPVLCEKVDAADSIWTVSAVLPMPLAAAPPPRNKGIALKELPPHRAVGRLLHGAVTPDDAFAKQKADLLPRVNDLCKQLGCSKQSTVVAMHRFPWWMPALFRVTDLLVRVSDADRV